MSLNCHAGVARTASLPQLEKRWPDESTFVIHGEVILTSQWLTDYSSSVGSFIAVTLVVVLTARMLWRPSNQQSLTRFKLVTAISVIVLMAALVVIVVARFTVLPV